MTQIRLDDAGMKAKIKRVQDSIGSRNMMDGIGLRHLKWINDNFVSRGAGKWAPLSPNTIASRRKGSSVPLQNTGNLRASFSHRVSILGSSVTAGTQNRIAEYHHTGTRPYEIRPRNGRFLAFMTVNGPVWARKVNHPGLPQRKLIPDEGEAKTLAVAIIEAALRKAVDGG